jgi:hypothetical protein
MTQESVLTALVVLSIKNDFLVRKVYLGSIIENSSHPQGVSHKP